MDAIILAAMNLVQEYSSRTVMGTLNEEEALLYAQCCRTAKVYLRSLENSFRLGLIEQERHLDKQLDKEEDNRKGGEDDEAAPVSEG